MTEFINIRTYEAKKEHKCFMCEKTIKPKEKYCRYSGKVEKEFYDFCLCDFCNSMVIEYCKTYGEFEWSVDDIKEFIHTCFCDDCDHGIYNKDDCENYIFECPYILEKMRKNDI